MIDPLVRRADLSAEHDLAQLSVLEAEGRASLVEQRGGPQWLAENPALGPGWDLAVATYARGRSFRAPAAWVATIDDVVVGYLVADVAADRALRVTHVWVTPEAREVGFGDALVEAAIAHGRATGATAIEGEALPGDRGTKNLWERAGIVARLIVTSRPL